MSRRKWKEHLGHQQDSVKQLDSPRFKKGPPRKKKKKNKRDKMTDSSRRDLISKREGNRGHVGMSSLNIYDTITEVSITVEIST